MPRPARRRAAPPARRQARGSQGLHRARSSAARSTITSQPETDAIKAYVEGGGHALFLLDPPLQHRPHQTARKHRRSSSAARRAGASPLNKDLALDTSGIGQIFGLGPEVPLVASYESHPIVQRSERRRHGLPAGPHAGRQERRQDHGREALRHRREQLRHHQPGLRPHPHRSQEGQEGPAHPGGRRHLQWHHAGAVRGGGQLHVGGQQLHPASTATATCSST